MMTRMEVDEKIWKKMTAKDLLDKAEKIHKEILQIILKSELPPTIAIGILNVVAHQIHDTISWMTLASLIEEAKKKEGGEKDGR